MPESLPGSGIPPNHAADAAHEGGPTEDAPRGGSDPLIGKVISGRFRVISVIARGGMGKVYKAEQAPLGRVCALKVLSPKYEGDKDPEFHKRFLLEASTAAKLKHSNTVTIFDYGQDEDIYFIAMEFIDGRTLFRELRGGPFSEARTAHITRQICRALREAHGLGVIHRDLKPGNVLLTTHDDDPDYVKVLDFGLVKDVTGEKEDLTQQGLFMGSPKYMAPEQILGQECSPRTDIYALGVMMYEMLCGRVPFDLGAGVGTLMAHVHKAPPPMQTYFPDLVLTAGMEAIVFKCLEKDPANRYGSMAELLMALKHLAGEDSMVEGLDPMAHSGLTPSPRSVNRSGVMSRPSITDHTPGPRSVLSTRDPGSGPNMRPPSSFPGPPVTSLSPDSGGFRAPSITDLSPAPAPFPDSGVVEPPPAKKRTLPFVIAGVAAIAAVVVVISSRSSSGPTTTTTTTASSATPSAAVTTAVTTTAAPTPSASAATVSAPVVRYVKIETSPPGAAVLENGKSVCDGTPCIVTWKDDDAKAEHKLTLSKVGFKPATVTVGASDEKVKEKLAPIPVNKATPEGYKDAY